MIIGNIFDIFFAYAFKPYGENDTPHDQISDKLLTWANSLGAGVINGLSRIVFGALIDIYSFKFLMIIMMVI